MDKIRICSPNFREFYMKLNVEKDSISEYIDVLKDAVLKIAHDINLGKFMLIVNSPATCLELEGLEDRSEIYLNPNGYNDNLGFRRTFVTDDWGIIQIEMSPQTGKEWGHEDSEEIKFLVQIVFDCIEKQRSALIMKQSTITDTLTGGCNVAGIINYATELKKLGTLEKYDAIYFYIKNFNYINQRIGAREGDKVLRSFSDMIRDFLCKGELFGRVGGDTFFILVEKDRTDECIKFLTSRRILVDLEKKSMEFDLMVRVGAYKIEPTDNADRVIECSKAAFSYTKNPSAGEIVWFFEDMLKVSSHDQEVSNNFAKALKRQEFVVYYQPKVDLSSGKLVSAEALCRWIRNGEVVPPMEFIPVLEREGSITDLDFYMLNKVCEHISGWIDKGIEPVRVSVNFSRAHILNKKLAEKIIKVIKSHKIENRYIEIEITETSGFEDFEAMAEFVNVMKENGVSTSIDDFGTGYSSLNLIKELNVDSVKLDKSFLENITNGDSQDKSVIRNVVNMINELDMDVVAEGVENFIQMDFLKEVKCSTAQGFLFDKPMPKEKFEFRLLGERMY